MSETIKKWDFTIERGKDIERTVVGRDGQLHHPEPNGRGRDGHFTTGQEGEYRRKIESAVAANAGKRNRPTSVKRNRVIRVGPLESDDWGLLPSDGFGRLSSEDY